MSDAPPKPKAGKAALAKVAVIAVAFAGGAAAGGAGAVMAFASMAPVAKSEHGKTAEHIPSPVAYVEIDNAFTSNLTDTGRYLQLRIAVSTTGGEAVVAALTTHKPAIVAAVLAVLGDCAEADIADRAAKTRLKEQLRKAVDAVLKGKAEGAHIDEVFLTSLVVQ